MTVTNDNKNKPDPGLWIGIVLLAALLFFTTKCNAQCDTIPCKTSCIKNTVIATTQKGTDRIYVVYSDPVVGIEDMIYVSKTVYNYIELCKKNNISPSIGIRFKNGQITSIVKYKKSYKIKK